MKSYSPHRTIGPSPTLPLSHSPTLPSPPLALSPSLFAAGFEESIANS